MREAPVGKADDNGIRPLGYIGVGQLKIVRLGSQDAVSGARHRDESAVQVVVAVARSKEAGPDVAGDDAACCKRRVVVYAVIVVERAEYKERILALEVIRMEYLNGTRVPHGLWAWESDCRLEEGHF